MPVRTAKFFILTTPCTLPNFPERDVLPSGLTYWIGQEELSASGLRHYQHALAHSNKVSAAVIRRMFVGSHVEFSRSASVYAYVHKDDTSVEGTRWELGTKPVNRASGKDWDHIWTSAATGDLLSIPADIRVRCYPSLCRIGKDLMRPEAVEKSVFVLHGQTGCGKSRTAWEACGYENAYPKNPNNRFWDGYRPREHTSVIIDEFRGQICFTELLRWCDRYPISVETKGSGCVLLARTIYITSNLHPREWYPNLDAETYAALLRRFTSITEFREGVHVYEETSSVEPVDGQPDSASLESCPSDDAEDSDREILVGGGEGESESVV